MNSFQIIELIGSGSYGKVYKAIHNLSKCTVALKIISVMNIENGLPVEVKYLMKLRDGKNVIHLLEYFYSNDDKLVMVFEYVEYDLWKFISPKNKFMTLSCAKFFIHQLLEGLDELHSKKIMHLDIKPSNLLINSKFDLKIADFGFTTFIGNPHLSHQVISLFYRPPELLMGSKNYGPEVDIWSVGCIIVEMLTGYYMFAGSNESNQLELIFKTLGTPTENNWPGVSKLQGYNPYTSKLKRYPGKPLKDLSKFKNFSNTTLDLILKMLTLSPKNRISTKEALNHPWFTENPIASPPSEDIIHCLISRPVKSSKHNQKTNNLDRIAPNTILTPKRSSQQPILSANQQQLLDIQYLIFRAEQQRHQYEKLILQTTVPNGIFKEVYETSQLLNQHLANLKSQKEYILKNINNNNSFSGLNYSILNNNNFNSNYNSINNNSDGLYNSYNYFLTNASFHKRIQEQIQSIQQEQLQKMLEFQENKQKYSNYRNFCQLPNPNYQFNGTQNNNNNNLIDNNNINNNNNNNGDNNKITTTTTSTSNPSSSSSSSSTPPHNNLLPINLLNNNNGNFNILNSYNNNSNISNNNSNNNSMPNNNSNNNIKIINNHNNSNNGGNAPIWPFPFSYFPNFSGSVNNGNNNNNNNCSNNSNSNIINIQPNINNNKNINNNNSNNNNNNNNSKTPFLYSHYNINPNMNNNNVNVNNNNNNNDSINNNPVNSNFINNFSLNNLNSNNLNSFNNNQLNNNNNTNNNNNNNQINNNVINNGFLNFSSTQNFNSPILSITPLSTNSSNNYSPSISSSSFNSNSNPNSNSNSGTSISSNQLSSQTILSPNSNENQFANHDYFNNSNNNSSNSNNSSGRNKSNKNNLILGGNNDNFNFYGSNKNYLLSNNNNNNNNNNGLKRSYLDDNDEEVSRQFIYHPNQSNDVINMDNMNHYNNKINNNNNNNINFTNLVPAFSNYSNRLNNSYNNNTNNPILIPSPNSLHINKKKKVDSFQQYHQFYQFQKDEGTSENPIILD